MRAARTRKPSEQKKPKATAKTSSKNKVSMSLVPLSSLGRARLIPPSRTEHHDLVDLVLLGPQKAMAFYILKALADSLTAAPEKSEKSSTRLLWHDGKQLWKYGLENHIEPTIESEEYRKVYLTWHGDDDNESEYTPSLTQTYRGQTVPVPIVPITSHPIDPDSAYCQSLRMTPGVVHNVVHLESGRSIKIPVFEDQIKDIPIGWFRSVPTAPYTTLGDFNRKKSSGSLLGNFLAFFFVLAVLLAQGFAVDYYYGSPVWTQVKTHVEKLESLHQAHDYIINSPHFKTLVSRLQKVWPDAIDLVPVPEQVFSKELQLFDQTSQQVQVHSRFKIVEAIDWLIHRIVAYARDFVSYVSGN